MIRALGDWLERRRGFCYALAALIPVVARLAMLPWLSVPIPQLHDEFGHLLVADTLRHGRLANPPHPVGDLLETVYVLQKTSYASKYPIGQGAALTVGVAVGEPWIGVLAGGAAMGAAFLYALLGALPMPVALAGAMAGGLRFGAFSYWMDSYWGGSVCAIGSALLLGGMLRWFASPTAAAARVAMAGWGIVFLVRPYESVGVAAVVAVGLLIRQPRRFAVYAAPVLGLVGALTISHNYAATGHLFRAPYQQAQIEYGVPQSLLFQPALKPPAGLAPDQQGVANWQLNTRRGLENPAAFRFSVKLKSEKYWKFYWGWGLTALGAVGLILGRDWRLWFSLVIALAPLAQSWFYPFYFEHYTAGAAPAAILIASGGVRKLARAKRIWKVILPAAAAVLLAGSAFGPLPVILGERWPRPKTGVDARPAMMERLKSTPGKDLVLVRRFPRQDATFTWVWNEADVDGSEVVWAWEPAAGAERQRLLNYFKGRRVWVLRLETGRPELAEATAAH